MIKIAIIGLGHMGQNHLRVLMNMSNVDIVGLSDIDVNILKETSDKYNLPIYYDYKQLLKEKKPDVVIIVVPTIFHYEISLYCINLGIHILIEKPIAESSEKALEMIDTAKKMKVILGVGYIERFNPAIIELKKKIDNGMIGKIFMLHSQRKQPYPQRIFDVGVASDLATHELDMMRYITESEVENLYAETLYVMGKNNEDIIFGLIRFQNNILGILDVNWVTPTRVREISITGEKGMFVVDYLNQELIFYENPAVKSFETTNWKTEKTFNIEAGNMIKYQINKKEPLRCELESFINSVERNVRHLVDGFDGYQAILLAEKIIESGKRGL